MPAFHNWAHGAQRSRMPLTPPEYPPGNYLTPMSALSDHTYFPAPNYHHRQGQSGREFIDRFAQVPAYAPQTTQARPRSSLLPNSLEYNSVSAFAHNGPVQFPYAPIGTTILPPIRGQDHVDVLPPYVHAHPEPQPKEEKATGGVAAHLDYDMELMASFVAEMSQGIVNPGVQPTAQFRKYVSQILSSTRLPSSTIMLGLFYLASRMKLVSAKGEDARSSGTIYRMLTTGLLLGSKFLDDNTFQNRSWAEVSSIPVNELNAMELQWLQGFNWVIHGPMYDKEDGFYMWVDHWHAYEQKAQLAKVKEMQKLAPIDTNIHHSYPIKHEPLMSPDGPIPSQYLHNVQYDTHWVRPLISEYSPPSAPHSGPGTPDYYGNWGYAQAPPSYSRSSWNPKSAPYGSQRSQPPSYHHTPSYNHQYTQSAWTGHGQSCGCTLCAKQSDYYFNHANYGMQTVVG